MYNLHLMVPSPLITLRCSEPSFWNSSPEYYWTSLASCHLLGWAFLALAHWRLKTKLNSQKANFLFPAETPLNSSPRRRRLLQGANPITWIILRDRTLYKAAWGYAIATLLQMLIIWPSHSMVRSGMPIIGIQGLMFGLAILEILIVSWMASTFIVRSKQTGEIELLLTSPEGIRNILTGHFNALFRLLIWPVVGGQLIYVFYFVLFAPHEAMVYNILHILLNCIVRFASIAAICTVSLWIGATRASVKQAAIGSLILCFVVPFIASYSLNFVVVFLLGRLGTQFPIWLFSLSLTQGGCLLIVSLFAMQRLKIALGMDCWGSGFFKKSYLLFQRLRHWTPSASNPPMSSR
jgi:hypothetical protein